MMASEPIVQSSPRVRRRQERNRRALLRAARTLMARHGYDKTTIAAITRAADLGFGTFYLYFQGKEDILRALVDDAVQRHIASLDHVNGSASSGAEAVRRIVERYVDAAIEHRDLFKIMFEHGGERREPLRRVHEALVRALDNAIARGLRDGEFRHVHPALAARAIAGMLPAALLWAARSRSVSRDTLVTTLVDLALRGLSTEEG
jgi:AcrR family transcriptional regulator